MTIIQIAFEQAVERAASREAFNPIVKKIQAILDGNRRVSRG